VFTAFENPLTVPAEEITDISGLMTMIGGNVEYRADNYETKCASSTVETTSSSTSSETMIPMIVPLVALIALLYTKKKLQI
jgi:hypothetical protein